MKRPKNCIYPTKAHCLVWCIDKNKCEYGKTVLRKYKRKEE